MKKLEKFNKQHNKGLAADKYELQIAGNGIIVGLEITKEKPYCGFCGYNVYVSEKHKKTCMYTSIIEGLKQKIKTQ